MAQVAPEQVAAAADIGVAAWAPIGDIVATSATAAAADRPTASKRARFMAFPFRAGVMISEESLRIAVLKRYPYKARKGKYSKFRTPHLREIENPG
ncbi:hypothetical protein Kisp02_21420 [Kineosporia sp. NBRC 101731]|nr:hypothetical protein Kisp02_21420 [Kineosporia sp. NBRC 101731]